MLLDEEKPTVALHVPRKFRRGQLGHDEAMSVNSGLQLLDLIGQRKPVEGAKMLDMGCGVKVAQALYERGSPQKLYVGLDVYKPMIRYMRNALSGNAKYRFKAVDFHNEKYNKDGVRMDEVDDFPVRRRDFDILTMFSVITHMVPDDARDVLKKLRAHAADDAVLIFSTFVSTEQEEDFVDLVPEKPLFKASYRKDFLETIIGECGWRIEEFHPIIKRVITNHYVCRPA